MESKYNVACKKMTNVYSLGNSFSLKPNLKNVNQANDKQKNVKPTQKNTAESSSGHNRPVPMNANEDRKKLPVYNCRKNILKEIENSNTLLIMGETGSGKTTQIPQFLLEAGYGSTGIIGVTQPRRVAAITLAKRVANELGTNLGQQVGYTVRFEDCTTKNTRIRFITDGSLLREALLDRLLRHYSVLMLDEVHERTVNTDILLGIAKEAQKQRQILKLNPLKIIITSATMDIANFSKYFGVRGMYLEGRTHPVRIMHTRKPQPDYFQSTLITLFEIHRNMPINYDVLVFLTGQEEIDAAVQQIQQIAKINFTGCEDLRVFPLYAQLPQVKQLEVFLPVPVNTRKVVIATNIAETSITIPGIRCVIDCGYVKQKLYSPCTGLDILRTTRISQAQAWQRCGRAGRDTSGFCYRIYTQEEMNSFDQKSQPEILRSNISSVVLQLLSLGIDCDKFSFIDKPTPDILKSSYIDLESLGAISPIGNKVTNMGNLMTQYPLDPKYSKLILSASAFNCLEEIISIVSLLCVENVFIKSNEKSQIASLAHAKFRSKYGDHLTLLNVFTAFKEMEKPKLWCHDNFLNARNIFYAEEVRKQLLEIAHRQNLEFNSSAGNIDDIRKCLITGLFKNIAELQRDNYYLTMYGHHRAKIHPSSVLHGTHKPSYVLFSEIIFTERNYLRQVSEIKPEWIEEVLPNYKFMNKIKKKM